MDLRGNVDATRELGFAALALVIALVFFCIDAAPSLAGGDAAKGKETFNRLCGTCHTAESGGENRFGPNLFGIIGRKAGSAPGFNYSNAFKSKANWEWSEDMLGNWIAFPSAVVPGTAMGLFQGAPSRDRPNIIAYLETLK